MSLEREYMPKKSNQQGAKYKKPIEEHMQLASRTLIRGLHESLSVREYLAAIRRINRMPHAARQQVVETIMAHTDAEGIRDWVLERLDEGPRRRLANHLGIRNLNKAPLRN